MSAGSSLSSRTDRARCWIPAIALAIFAGTTSRFPFPDESLSLLCGHLGLDPFRPMANPVWGWLVRLLAAVSPWSAAFLPNLLSAACGVGCICIFFSLVRRLDYPASQTKAAPGSGALAASAASLYLIVTVPFWIAANRAHPALFDLLWLLGILVALARLKDRFDQRHTWTIPLLLCSGAVESTTILACAPFLGAYYFLLLRAHRRLTRQAVGRALSALLLAGAVAAAAIAEYLHSSAAGWREFSGWGQGALFFAKERWSQICGSVPAKGWMLLLVGSIVPWACCMWMPRESSEPTRRGGSALLFSVILVVSLAMLFNARVAPWRMTGMDPLLVTPAVFSAASFGYAIAYLRGQLRLLDRRQHQLALAAQVAFLGLVGLSVLFAGILNFETTNSRGVRAAAHLARSMVGHLQGRSVLISEGLMDDPLRLAARDLGVKLDVVNQRLVSNLAYRRYAASLVDSRRLRALAMAGFQPFLTQWLRWDRSVSDRLAFQASPDAWLANGFDILPYGSLYLGVPGGASTESAAGEVRAFWRDAAEWLDQMRRGYPAIRRLAEQAGRHVSSVANDFGVHAENEGRMPLAEEAYGGALRLAPNNLSAWLNLRQRKLAAGEQNGALVAWKELERLSREQRVPLKVLVDTFGHVRTRAALTELEKLYGRAGNASEPEQPLWTQAMELLRAGDREGARAKVKMLLAKEPHFDAGWILLGTMAYDDDDRETLQQCLRQMRSDEKEWPQLLAIMGRDALKHNRPDDARQYFERALHLWPDSPDILENLVRLDLSERRNDLMASRLDDLLTLDPGNAVGNFCLGALLFRNGESELAEDAYRAALATSRYPPALNNLAWVLQSRGALDEALALAREATAADPESYQAWDTLGVVQMKKGQLADAAESLRRASVLDSRLPDAPVHLAQLQALRGDKRAAADEARKLRLKFGNLSADLRRILDGIE